MSVTTKILRIAFIVLLLILAIRIPKSFSSELRSYAPGQMVCRVSNPTELDSIYQEYGCEYLEYNSYINDYLLTTDTLRDIDSLADMIALRPNVIYCRPNYLLYAPEPVQASQPFIDEVGGDIYPQQTAVQTLKLDSAHEYTTGSSITVGVIDGGIDFNHEILQTNVISGYDYIDNDSLAQDESGGGSSGHGTFVAGIIRLVAPHAQIMAFRVLDTAGAGDGFHIAEAITEAAAANCEILNLSFIMSGQHPSIEAAIEFAKSNEVLVVAAAGNDSSEVDKYPASSVHTLSVTAVDSFGVKADFANYGTSIDLVAPGTGIYASFIGDQYARWDGTSFAAPFVSGQAALLYAMSPGAGWQEIHNSICSLAVNIDSLNPAYAGKLGFGLIDPLATILQSNYVCGDINNDGTGTNILDLNFLVNYIFRFGPVPANFLASNCDGILGSPDILDLTCVVNYLFREGPDPLCVP